MFKKLGIVLVCAAVLTIFCGTPVKAEAPATPAQRQEHEQAAEKKLSELDKRMSELSVETKKAEGKTQSELNKLYEDFKKQQGAAKGSLEELRRSTNETWDKAKANVDKAIENLNGLYERSKAKAKENSKDKEK
jgi:hypothetical protein